MLDFHFFNTPHHVLLAVCVHAVDACVCVLDIKISLNHNQVVEW